MENTPYRHTAPRATSTGRRWWMAVCCLLLWQVATILPTFGQSGCPAVGLPLQEAFEGSGELPTCWVRWENFDYQPLKAHIVSSPTAQGNGALMMSGGNTAEPSHESMVMAQVLSQSPAGITMKMKVRANVGGAKLLVGVSSSTSNVYEIFRFQAVDTITIATANTWTEVTVDFSQYSGNGDRPTFRIVQGMQPGPSTMVYIDALSVERCWVENLRVDHQSDNELRLYWTSMGNGTTDLTVTPQGGGETLNFSDVQSPYRLQGLAAGTTYTLTLTPQCSGEAQAGRPESITATTLDGTRGLVTYCEGFESAALPAGWQHGGSAGPTSLYHRSGGRSLRLQAGQHWAVLPLMVDENSNAVSLNGLMLNFYLYASNSNLRLQVATTDYPLEPTEFTPIDTLVAGVSNVWTPQLATLQYGGTKRFLVLRVLPSATSGDLYLDDLRVGRCLLTGVGLTGYTSTSATLEWDAPLWSGTVTGTGSEEWSVASGDSVVGGKQYVTLRGLAPGSSHTYSIYGTCDPNHCGATEVTFTTFAQEYPLPYCTDFEGGGTLPVDWQTISGESGYPQVQGGTSHSGTRALRLGATGGVSSSHTLVLLPPVRSGQQAGVTVSFAVKNDYAGGTLQVGIVSGELWESNFSPVATLSPATGEWTRVSVAVNTYSGEGQRLALRYYHSGYGVRYLWVDDLEVNRHGVSNVNAYGERSDGATLSWSATGGTVDIQYRKGTAGVPVTVEGATSPLNLNDLDEGSTYHYYVRSTTGDEQGCWMYGGSFVTNSGALRADYCHPTAFSVSAGAAPWSLSYLEETSFAGLMVSFDAVGSGNVQAGLMTDVSNVSTFTSLGSFQATAAGRHCSVMLTGHEAQGHFVALRSTSGTVNIRNLRISHGGITSTTVEEPTAHTALLRWSTEGAVDSLRLTVLGGTGGVALDTTFAATRSSLPLTGLEAGTTYTYSLTAISTQSQRSCGGSEGQFMTLATDVAEWWCEDFDGTSAGTLPTGWTTLNEQSGDPAVYYRNGSRQLRMTSSSSSSAIAALPSAGGSLAGLVLRMDVEASGNPGQSLLVVGTMTDRGTATTFRPIDTVAPTQRRETHLVRLGNWTAASGRVLALKYLSPGGTRTIYVDNMTLARRQVNNLRIDEETNHSLRLTWEGCDTARIAVGGIDTVVRGGRSLTLEGLTAATTYVFHITAGSGGTEAEGDCHEQEISGRTLEEAMMAPLCLDLNEYNSATQLPWGWSEPSGAGNASRSTTRFEGSSSIRLYSSGGYATVVSPMLEETSLTDLYLSFYMLNSGNGRLEVGVMSDARDEATFTLLATYQSATTWTRMELPLSGAPAGARYVAFRHLATSGSSLYIDKLMMQSCPMPTAYTTNPRPHTMEVHWSDTGDDMWIAYGTSTYNMRRVLVPRTGSGEQSYTLEGLSANTNYTVELWPQCGEEEFECHTLQLSQRTLPLPYTLGYCQNFVYSTMPSDWRPLGEGVVGTTTNTPTGNRGLQLSVSQSVAQQGGSAMVVMPGLATAPGCTPPATVYMDLMRTLTSGSGVLEVGVMSNVMDTASFTVIHTLAFGQTPWTWQDTVLPIATSHLENYLALRLKAAPGSGATACVDNVCVQYCYVKDIAIDSATPSEATFSWTSYGVEEVTLSWSSADGGSGSGTTTQSPYTARGFTPNATYNFTLTGQCPCDQDVVYHSAVAPLRFPADTMVLPLCHTFEDYGEGGYPYPWRRLGGSNGGYPRVISSTEGSYLDMYTGQWSPLYLVMEPLDEGVGAVVVSGRVMCSNDDAVGGRLEVGTLEDPERTSGYAAVGTVGIEALDTWTDFHMVLPQAEGRHPTLRFAPGAGSYHLYVDDIAVSRCAVTSLRGDGERLHIEAVGEPTQYRLTIKNRQGVGTREVTTVDSVVAYGDVPISGDSTYMIRVATRCGEAWEEGCGERGETIGYRMALPYCERFTDKMLEPEGWEVARRNNATYPRAESYNNGSMRYHMRPTSEGDNLVLLPQLPVGISGGGLHVWAEVRLGGSSSIGYCRLEIGTYDGTTFTALAQMQNSTLLQNFNITLPATNATRLALRAVSTQGARDIYIQSLQITRYAQPDSLSYTQAGSDHQHIYWHNTNGNDRYLVEWGPAGFEAGTGTRIASDSCHALLQPLQPSTQYHVYLYSPDTTLFCTHYSFTTLPPAVEVPYCDNGNHNLAAGSLFYLPEVATAVDSLTMRLEWRTSANGRLVVGALTDRYRPASFVPIDTLIPTSANQWQTDYVDLHSYADTGVFVALRFVGATGAVRQISLQRIPQPTFHVLNSSSVEVSTSQNPVDYYLRVCRNGYSPSSGTLHHVTTSPYIVNGLQPYTEYDFYAQADATGTTCAPPVTHRTHLDVELPYCTDLASQPTGWYFDQRFRVMPYVIVDSLVHTHLYFTSRGRITVGVVRALDDTALFVALSTFNDNAPTEQVLHLNLYRAEIDSLHYIAFRYESSNASIGAVALRRVPAATFRVTSSSEIEATLPEGQQTECWIRVTPHGLPQNQGTLYHMTTSPYTIGSLAMYTEYDLYTLGIPNEEACDPPTTLRTHLDIAPPYCVSTTTLPDGWWSDGRFDIMPYIVIDTLPRLWITFRSRGAVTLGSTSFLTDTTAFLPITTFNDADWTTHTIHLTDYPWSSNLPPSHHYLAFRAGELQSVTLRTCPMPQASLVAFNKIEFTQPGDQHDYWLHTGGSHIHVTESPYLLQNLQQNTLYPFTYSCDSLDQACLVDTTILTGVQIQAPHCADLDGYRFANGTLPPGWFTLSHAGRAYAIMPIIDIDSLSSLFVRLQYRIPQAGTLLEVGGMTNPYDPSTFRAVASLSTVTGEMVDSVVAFREYGDTGLYVAFRAGGAGVGNVELERVELQRVPFVRYLLTDYDRVSIVPTDGVAYPHPVSIVVGEGEVVADSLPWEVEDLGERRTIGFNVGAEGSTVPPCAEETTVRTSGPINVPACDLGATLTADLSAAVAEGEMERLWVVGTLPEDVDPGTLLLRARVSSAHAGNRVEVGLMTIGNVGSTFRPLDTMTITSTGSVLLDASLQGARAEDGRFLALRLLPTVGSTRVEISEMQVATCLAPQTGGLSLVRHNVVRYSCDSTESIEGLWINYGPGTSQPLASHTMLFTLENGRSYDFRITCDSGGTSCTEPMTIRTLEAPEPLSWCEDFEEGTAGSVPANWQEARSGGATGAGGEIDGGRGHSGGRSLRMNAGLGRSYIAVLPDAGLDSLRGISLSLWIYTAAAGGHLEIGTIVDPTDPETFTPIHTLRPGMSGRWERFLVDMNDAPLETYYIALRCNGEEGANEVWVDDIHVSECGSNHATLTDVDASGVTLRWRQTGRPRVTVEVVPEGGTGWTVQAAEEEHYGQRTLSIDGLTPLTNYSFIFHSTCSGESTGTYCTNEYVDTLHVFTPEGSASCVDPTNFHASYTSCFYGTYDNPTEHEGFVDYGYSSPMSRHTVHYNQNETDPRTGNQLHTVPEGATATVRLGNWTYNSSSPEAEQLVYGINVDTLEYDLLILRYAAVLQDPRHAATEQPRFSLELLDEGMGVLDEVCGRADFIASYEMGWNVVGETGVLWKDWTTVGIDLAPYAGRTIYVRLTTRDCGEGSHFGYAYFTLRCMRKNITTASCGVVEENELRAPGGFNYRWYRSGEEEETLGRGQSLVVPTNDSIYYYCHLSFVDNPVCWFRMRAFAGRRYPLSLFDYRMRLGECRMEVDFTNRSTITMDGERPVGTGEGVETARWSFGNGEGSTDYNASTWYEEEGEYEVQLVTGIAMDACLDTLTARLNVVFPETGVRITGRRERCMDEGADTLYLHNVVELTGGNAEWEEVDSAEVGSYVLRRYRLVVAPRGAGVHSYTATVRDSIGCTVSVSHTMVVHPVYSEEETLHLCSTLLPYAWHDTTLAPRTGERGHWRDSVRLQRYTQYGCDSLFYLDLNIYDNGDYTQRDTTRDGVCDNGTYFFSDSLLVPDAALTHNRGEGTMVYTDSLRSWIGCDSLSTIVLTVHPTYDHTMFDTVCSNEGYTWGTPEREVYAPWLVGREGSPAAPIDTSWTDGLTTVQGCDSMSTLRLNIPPAYHHHLYDTICDGELRADSTWQQHTYAFETGRFDTTGVYPFSFSTAGYQCDSVRSLHLKVYPTHDIHLYDTIYDGDLYTFETGTFDTTGLYNYLFATAAFRCDSLRTLHLQRNRRTYIDTVVCQNSLPLRWHANRLFLDGTGIHTPSMQILADSVHLQGVDGIDSLVVMTVIVRDTAATVDIVHSCDSLIWEHSPDTTYRISTSAPSILLSQQGTFDTTGLSYLASPMATLRANPRLSPFHVSTYQQPLATFQCDSVRHLDLTISYTHRSTDYIAACDSLLWPTHPLSRTSPHRFYADTLGHAGPLGSFRVDGPVDSLLTTEGCDSVVNLDLAIFHATYEEAIDTFCFGETYAWRQFTVGVPLPDSILHTYLTDTLQTHTFVHPHTQTVALTCDSVLAIRLSQMPRPFISLLDSIDCVNRQYHLQAHSDMPYTRWSSSPHDPSLDGHRFDTLVTVQPTATTHYYLYADYHPAPLCPYSDTLSLVPVVVPEAQFRVNPEVLTWQRLDFNAYDLTDEVPSHIHPEDTLRWERRWFIDEEQQDERSRHLYGNMQTHTSSDSITLALEVFNGQCRDTAVIIVPKLLVSLYAPNIFTPLEANNNRFTIVAKGIIDAELFIYNREGLLIYHTDNLDQGWDGRTSQGELCPQGAYVWKLNYHAIDRPSDLNTEVGTVTLLK